MPPELLASGKRAGNPRREIWRHRLAWLLARPATHLCTGLAILAVDYFTPHAVSLMFPILFVIPVGLAAWWCNARLAYVLAGLLPVGRFFLAEFMDMPGHLAANVFNAVIRAVVLGLLAFFVARAIRLEHEVKVLKGTLPICMYCKRIRTGPESWQQMETYITQHSEALFNHTMCPPCAKKYYGELLGQDQNINTPG
jgi:hypothetical protein